jgi:hypothetical protein
MFDPSRKPQQPESVNLLDKERRDYFDPKLVEGGFTVEEAQELGWVVDLYHASKPFPGLGQVEVHSKDSDQGRYGVLKAVYDFELGQHQRAQGRARETYLRLVRVERQQLQALDAAKGGESYKKAMKHAREALRISTELDAFGLLELPDEYINELREERARNFDTHNRRADAPQPGAGTS